MTCGPSQSCWRSHWWLADMRLWSQDRTCRKSKSVSYSYRLTIEIARRSTHRESKTEKDIPGRVDLLVSPAL